VGTLSDRVIAGLPTDGWRVAVDSQGHQFGVRGHARHGSIGPVARHLPRDLGAMGTGVGHVAAGTEIPAPCVVDVAVGVVVKSVVGDLTEIGPDVIGDVRMSRVHAGIDHGHDHTRTGVAQIVPDLLGTHGDDFSADRGVGVRPGRIATGRTAAVDPIQRGLARDPIERCRCLEVVDLRMSGRPVVQDPTDRRESGQALDDSRFRLERQTVDSP
jgi:hypothetical protein